MIFKKTASQVSNVKVLRLTENIYEELASAPGTPLHTSASERGLGNPLVCPGLRNEACAKILKGDLRGGRYPTGYVPFKNFK